MKYNQVRLNSGATMPVIGFGTYSSQNEREETKQAVLTALKLGYRHFDTAKIYGSEPALGDAITGAILDGVTGRGDVFLTSKLWSSDHHDPVSAIRQTLKKLRMEYVDLYLVHWPVKLKTWVDYPVPREEDFERLELEATWSGMERCLDLGLCRSIGVSNFSSKKVHRLLDYASVTPAVNQVEMHPMWRQTKLREFSKDHKIHVSAYSPLGGPGNLWGSTAVIDHPIIQSIALKHGATPAQVALRWGLSKGASVIVKSFNRDRIKENIGALNLTLDEQDLINIEKMEQWKIMRGEFLVNDTTSPYKNIQGLWDDEI
ncbi:hypothetical protein NMG60_11012223 [Bertholletia excelsa]